jgi:hypothetical protein
MWLTDNLGRWTGWTLAGPLDARPYSLSSPSCANKEPAETFLRWFGCNASSTPRDRCRTASMAAARKLLH